MMGTRGSWFLLALALTLGGCSGGDGDDSPGAGTGGSGGRPPPITAGSGGTGGTGAAGSGGGTADAGSAGSEASGGNGAAGSEASGRFAPPAGQTLLIIGQNVEPTVEYVNDTGDVPAGFMTYTSINYLNGFDHDLPRQNFHTWPDTYDDIVMQVGLWLTGGADLEEHLRATLAGQYDANIDSLASHFQTAGVPVFLRIGYEVNGRFPPALYPDAYRYIRSRLLAQGATDVAFVWHVTPGYTQTGVDNHFDWYPGDDVVDWIALSWFVDVVGGGGIDAAAEAQTQTNLHTIAGYARDHSIPLMIGEAAPMKEFEPALGQPSWDQWYVPLFAFIEEYDVQALSYINQRWSDVGWEEWLWGDSRVQTNQTVYDNWLAAVHTPRYLYAGPDLYSRIGFVP